MKRLAATAALVALLGAASCPVGPGVSGRVDVAQPGADAVVLTYLGVGGWIFERDGVRLLAAPLFTNPSLLRTGLAGIRSDSLIVDRFMGEHDVSDARAILVGHGHYDHLMDVPGVARRHAPAAAILGSGTVRNLLGSWSGVAARVLEIDTLAGDVERAGAWIGLGPGLRVMALRSHHAPHFEGYTLYRGSADAPHTEEPSWATEWVDGPTFAFLIDFLDPDGSVVFRVYYQDAVAAAPLGLAPEAVIAERPVDVAVLVAATFDQVEWHPEAFVENLRPRWVLLGHWENFFVPPDADARSIMLTDMPYFEKRLRRVHGGDFWRPEAGTVFRFPVG